MTRATRLARFQSPRGSANTISRPSSFFFVFLLIVSCSNDVSKPNSIDIGDGNFLLPGIKNIDAIQTGELCMEAMIFAKDLLTKKGVFISNRIAYSILKSLNWGLGAALATILLISQHIL